MRIAGKGLAKSAGKVAFTIGVVLILVISHRVPSHADVKITAPASNITVSGTVTVKAKVTHDHTSQLVVDGVMVASAG